VAIIQIAFDMVTVVAVFAIARRVGNAWTGLWAAAFTAFYPYLLFQNLTANDTAIFIMLVSVGLWAVYRLDETRSIRWIVLTGLLFGLAALTKTLVALILPMLALWWWSRYGFKTAVKYGLVLGVSFALLTVPWAIRNSLLNGELTFISTNDGSNLAQGNNPCVIDYLINAWDVQWTTDNPRCITKPADTLSDKEQARVYRNQALSYIQNNLGRMPQLWVLKFMNLWSPEIMPRSIPPDAVKYDNSVEQYEGTVFKIARTIHLFYFTPLLILGVFGWWKALRDHRLIIPVLILPAAITISYLIYHTSTRYRSPADPFVFIGSAYAVTWLWQWWSKRRSANAPSQARTGGHASTS
jgi:4-amino-4-deoxy-L-arabinose transferase-like glycosyltransferase